MYYSLERAFNENRKRNSNKMGVPCMENTGLKISCPTQKHACTHFGGQFMR